MSKPAVVTGPVVLAKSPVSHMGDEGEARLPMPKGMAYKE
jgi:hypothetical protein